MNTQVPSSSFNIEIEIRFLRDYLILNYSDDTEHFRSSENISSLFGCSGKNFESSILITFGKREI